MKDALPMPGELLPPKDVDLHNGYIWKHGNYTTKHTGLQAERQFVPPNALRSGLTQQGCQAALC